MMQRAPGCRVARVSERVSDRMRRMSNPPSRPRHGIARTLPAVPARLGDRAARAGAGRLHAGRRRAAPGPPAISFCSAAGGPPSVMTALMDARASPAMSDMSAMSDPRDGGHAGQADDAAQECPFWMVAHQTLDLPPLPICRPCPPPPASVAPPAPLSLPPLLAAGRRSRAPRLSRPWPDRTIRARPRAFPAAVPSACLSPPCAAFPVHDPRARVGTRAAVRHAKTETHRHAEPEFPNFPRPGAGHGPGRHLSAARAQRRPPSTWIRWSSPPSRPIRR